MILPSCLRHFPEWVKPNSRLLSLIALSLCFTLLNAAKPLHIDDVGFYCFARQIAADPASPYGFTMVWESEARPAIEILAPPVLPYWWAAGIRLFGDEPVLWKLWLLPFNLLLVLSLAALLRRFVQRIEVPLLWMTVLSPALLPGVNLMTDIPALALSLFALTVFLRACDRGSVMLTVAAGLTVGFAMQTKYTAFVTPAVLISHAFLVRRTWLGLVAGSLAALVFVSWEGFLVMRHGQSHFLCVYQAFHHPGASLLNHVVHMFLALPSVLGGLAPAVLLLGLMGLGWPMRRVLAAGVVIIAAFLGLAMIPEHSSNLLASPASGRSRLALSHLIYFAMGVGLFATMAAVTSRLLRMRTQAPGQASQSHESFWVRARLALQHPTGRVERFLVIWLGLELACYAVISPFPAARRIVAVLVVATLLAGRLVGRTCDQPRRRILLWGVAAANVLLGLVFFGVDYLDARATQQAAEATGGHAANQPEGTTSWYVGCWGFIFYAERAGMQPLLLGQSRCKKGDLLIVDDHYFLYHDDLRESVAGRIATVDHVTVVDSVPLRTVVDYYAGRRPLRRLEGPRASATVYRVIADFVPPAKR
jgi:hypothetical protein